MAIDDRKKRILEHIKKSTEGRQYISAKNTSGPITPPPVTPSPVPEAKPLSQPIVKDDRKQKIMTHINLSSGNFGNFSLEDDTKKKKVEDHIRKSLS